MADGTTESSLALAGDRRAAELDPLRLLVALAAPVEMRALGEDPYGLAAYDEPAGDPGLYGPRSVVWRVHADLPALLFGGHSSLLLQSLHPRVMAGVSDHSSMGEDLVPRLLRTARFVLWTTFGGTDLAESIIDEVRRLHARVRGHTADGRYYSANDPDLLTYVHVAEVWSLLRAYQRYSARPLTRSDKDRYLTETAFVAQALGARRIPQSVSEVRAYFERVAPELGTTEGSEVAFDLLDQPMSDHPIEVVTHRVLHAAALDLLPDFAKRMTGFSPSRPVTVAVRAAAHASALAMRQLSGPAAIAEAARRRVARRPAA